MIRSLGSVVLSLFLASLFASVPQGDGHDICERHPNFTHVPGECYQRFVDDCNLTTNREYRLGCVAKSGIQSNCALCVNDSDICLTKPKCYRENGMCVDNRTDCDKLAEEKSNGLCDGPDCYCCRDGCTRKPECADFGGYCIRKNDTCSGTQWNNGCDDTMDLGLKYKDDCACCVPDTSICIPKVSCKKKGGTAKKTADCTGTSSSDALGDDCVCCVG